MGKPGLVILIMIAELHFDFALSPITKFCDRRPFVMIQYLSLGCQTNHIVLLHFIQLEKHFIVVISPVHHIGGFPEQIDTLLYRFKGDGV